jgi:glycosyl-4,4'-diaponeurosporenoate acyltransferase
VLREILVNAGAWALIQLGLVFIANRIPHHRFASAAKERNERFYRSLGIRIWKDKLPDGGNWFSRGFSKRQLRGRSIAELSRFARETRRAELVHWCAIAALPLFKLWNSWPAMLVNASYAIAANLPCILVQRYNRGRIARILR